MKYKLQDLIDIDLFQNLQDSLNEIYSFPSLIIDNDGNILTTTAWQDICTQFHRKNKDSARLCIKSDQYIRDHIHEADPAVSYRCPHGLVDNATPIIIDGIHYGNFFTGQFFLGEPDMNFFKAQAKKYGFKEDAYLEAVKKVPIWTQEQLDNYLLFIKGLVGIISKCGLKKIQEIETRKTIQKKEEQYQSILQTAMDGFWLTDIKGRLLDVNTTYCTMSGYSKEELLTMCIDDLEAFETHEIVYASMEKVAQKGSGRFESTHRRKDGTFFYVELSVQFRDEGGGQYVCFIRDTTESKNAEKALQDRESYMQSIFRAAPTGIGVVHDRIITKVNDKFCEMLGYSKDELIGQSAKIVYPSVEEYEKVGQEKYKEIKATGTGTVETVFKKKNGESINVLLSSTPIETYNLNAGITFTALDITNLKKAKKALLESNKQFFTVLDSIDAAVYVVDMKTHKILFMNRYKIDEFGRDMTGEICWKALRGKSKPCSYCDIDKLIDKKNVPTGVFVWHDQNPKTGRQYFNHDLAIEWTDGRLARLQVATDITEILKMEKRLQQAQKMESIGTLAGGIAHDFNNILFPIVGYAEMLLEDVSEDSPLRHGLNGIYTSALRAGDLVQQILSFSRQRPSELKLMKMQPIIKEALKLIRATIPTTISINMNLQPNCGIVKADPTQIHQVVMNLATNAYHAMEETGGELKVSLKEVELEQLDFIIHHDMAPGSYACLTIADTGRGMDKNLIDKIFDPFFTTKENGKGTGMGLSVVHGIVKAMNGEIRVYSEPGKGTEFYIYLPVVKSTSVIKEIQRKEPISRGTERVLLVDDEAAIIKMEKQVLDRLGYQVTSRTSSIEALEAFRANPDKFDLVITDMAMPKMPGDKLSVELTKIRPDIPVLLCTGFSETMSEEKAASLGIKGFLLKPIIMKDLAHKIREVLDKK